MAISKEEILHRLADMEWDWRFHRKMEAVVAEFAVCDEVCNNRGMESYYLKEEDAIKDFEDTNDIAIEQGYRVLVDLKRNKVIRRRKLNYINLVQWSQKNPSLDKEKSSVESIWDLMKPASQNREKKD